MIERLIEFDQKILLYINSLHTPFWDKVMLSLTYPYTWIPLYIAIIVFLFLKKRKEFLPVLIVLILAIISADLFASSFMKPFFHRLRPCHNPEIEPLLYMAKDMCGGKFGFVSSHSANTFALSTFLFLFLGREYRWIEVFFLWAGFVSLSRVYLGMHYPADVFVGAIIGISIACIYYYGYLFAKKKISAT